MTVSLLLAMPKGYKYVWAVWHWNLKTGKTFPDEPLAWRDKIKDLVKFYGRDPRDANENGYRCYCYGTWLVKEDAVPPKLKR